MNIVSIAARCLHKYYKHFIVFKFLLSYVLYHQTLRSQPDPTTDVANYNFALCVLRVLNSLGMTM